MANIWNTIAIIIAIIGFLALLGAWFTGTATAPGAIFGQTKDHMYYTAIALFLLALVIWIGAGAGALDAIGIRRG